MGKRILMHGLYKSRIDGKTIKHSFIVYRELFIGFTDGTWLAVQAVEDPESGVAELEDTPSLDSLPELLSGFKWDIVSEFEKAGIITDGQALRTVLREKRIAALTKEKHAIERRLSDISAEMVELGEGG